MAPYCGLPLHHLPPSHAGRYTFTRKGYEGLRKDVEKCLRNAHLLKVGARAAARCRPPGCGHPRREGRSSLGAAPCCASLNPLQTHGGHPCGLCLPLSNVRPRPLSPRPAPPGQAMLESAGVKTMLNELSSTVVFERPREEAFVRKWQLACEGDIAHVVVMPNITIRKLETFVQELVESR